jgi:prolyl oligopeptidase
VTRRDDEVVDILHGEAVADPYRWLEDTDSPETASWVEAQNAVTAAYLTALPGREEIRDRLSELWRVTRFGVPHERGSSWFFTRHDANADQAALRVADHAAADGRMLLDPNTLSDDGTIALASWAVTPDGDRLAYATSAAGSDWMTWRVRDVRSGKQHPDVVEWSKWSDAAWLPDGSGFFYGALDLPATGKEYLDTNDGMRLQLHLLGTAQDDDQVVYADPDPKWEPTVVTLDRGRWLVITAFRGTNPTTKIFVADFRDPARQVRPLLPAPDADYRVVGNEGAVFYVLTDDGAARKRVVAVDLDRPQREHWREVIAEGDDVLLDVTQVGALLVAHSLHDASSRLQVWSAAGALVDEIPLPPHVTVTELSGGEQPILHFGLTSFTDPGSVWAYDVEAVELRCLHDSALPIDADSLQVRRVTAPSEDGTAVPMFLLHRRDLTPDGTAPTLLYGYGGFNISMTPTFNAARRVWAERGGLLAVANLRGGGEYGKDWYDAGRLANKQNVFDDFAGCARWLATSGWTRADRIVINGGSNGGLLVAAVLTQHPELIGAAVPEVGVLDMLRYHKFTIGWGWTSDYGNPDDPEQYEWVRAFSPLHAIRPGTSYPPTLVMTGDHDDRVVPGHSFKFAATLQRAQAGRAPVLIRIETAGGHGFGTPVSKLVDARADMLAFCEAACHSALPDAVGC